MIILLSALVFYAAFSVLLVTASPQRFIRPALLPNPNPTETSTDLYCYYDQGRDSSCQGLPDMDYCPQSVDNVCNQLRTATPGAFSRFAYRTGNGLDSDGFADCVAIVQTNDWGFAQQSLDYIHDNCVNQFQRLQTCASVKKANYRKECVGGSINIFFNQGADVDGSLIDISVPAYQLGVPKQFNFTIPLNSPYPGTGNAIKPCHKL